MIPARAYLRVSTQRQKDEGASLDTQRHDIGTYSASHDAPVLDWYTDVLSGTRDDRPEYQRLLRDLRPGETVLLWRMDRVGRKKSERFRFFEWCKEHRVNIVSVTQPELSNELARDVLTIIDAYAIQELRERVLPNMAARAQEGRWQSKPPRWMRIGENGRLAPTEDAGDAQRAFQMFLSTGNVEATAVAFGANTGSMRQYLRNRAYIGEASWNGVTVEHAHPAIVDPALFDAVNRLLDTRLRYGMRERHETALLTGYLYVAGTERRMYQHTDKRSAHRWYTTHALHGALPRYSVQAAPVEAWVIDQLRGLHVSANQRREIEKELREKSRRDPDKKLRASLARSLATLEREQIETDRMRARGEIDGARWERMNRERTAEIAGIRARLLSLPPLPDPAAVAPLLDLRMHLRADIDLAAADGDIAGLRMLLAAFVARVEVSVEPTEGLAGRAASHWEKYPPMYEMFWNGDVVGRPD